MRANKERYENAPLCLLCASAWRHFNQHLDRKLNESHQYCHAHVASVTRTNKPLIKLAYFNNCQPLLKTPLA